MDEVKLLENELERNRRRYNQNEEAAIYHSFEDLIIRDGFVPQTEFVLPPNEFGIVGWYVDRDGAQATLVTALPSEIGQVVDTRELQARNDGADRFLTSVTSGVRPDGDRISHVWHAFDLAFKSRPTLAETTILVICTPGVVDSEDRNQFRQARRRTEILDCSDWLASSEPETVDVNFKELGEPIQLTSVPTGAENHEVYVGAITGETLASLYDRFGITLLDGNVRLFLGETGAVNKGIAETLRENPDHFCAYNNGITIHANHAQVENDHLVGANGLTIVNGGQTTVSIHLANRENVDLSHVAVPVKLIVSKGDDPIPLMRRVSACSNTQNAVKTADRMAMEEPHPKLEEISTIVMPPDGKAWYYERRRGAYAAQFHNLPKKKAETLRERMPKERVMPATDVAQAWSAWWGDPQISARGKQRNFEHYHTRMVIAQAEGSMDLQTHHRMSVGLYLVWSHANAHIKMQHALASASTPHVIGWLGIITGRSLDLVSFWEAGEIPESVKNTIVALSAPVDRYIRSIEDHNPTEWAKKIECRSGVLGLAIPEEIDIDRLPLTRATTVIPGDPLAFCLKIGVDNFWKMVKWMAANDVGFPAGRGTLGSMLNQWPRREDGPSPAQANNLARAWVEACLRGFDPDSS